jgi:hypothetical protein
LNEDERVQAGTASEGGRVAQQPQEQIRQALLDELIGLIEKDTYPSTTFMNMVEEMLTPDDLERYSEVLLDKVRDEQYPSVSMLARIRNLAGI